ncbi:MAG TPA: vWA domain-containing protein [Terriglobia bacterium]|nr:vWA domain-containing protein [Terriglobia bacterium]
MTYPYRRRHRQGNGVLLVILLAVFVAGRSCDRPKSRPSSTRVSTPVQNPIQDVLKPTQTQYRPGVAAAILIDTSGSMKERVRDSDGAMRPKIDIAQRAALDVVNQFDAYAREHAGQEIQLGIYEFSDRGGPIPVCRPIIKLGMPNPAASRTAILKMSASGDTPIGDAMIVAKRALDAAGLSKRHILVITDGENTQGYSPADVTQVITNLSETDRASIYFVAFDVAAAKFNSVKNSGGLVLAASNESELKGTLDYLLTGKILAEQPERH